MGRIRKIQEHRREKSNLHSSIDTDESDIFIPTFWLFNVNYAAEPVVWEKSKQFGVAAMQYEYGRESSSSVTRHINLIKNINVGDYIVAYSGNKGLLGYGQIEREFFEEKNTKIH